MKHLRRHTAVLAIGLVILGTLSAQSTLPPAKEAIDQRYAQERAGGAQNPAPKNPNAPYPVVNDIPFETGIIDDSDSPFSSQNLQIINRWQGVLNGVETIVYAGGESEQFNSQQGLVDVMTIPDYPGTTSTQTVLTPVEEGPVRIVSAQSPILTLISSTGSFVLTFDVSTDTFTSVVVDKTPPVITGIPLVTTGKPFNSGKQITSDFNSVIVS